MVVGSSCDFAALSCNESLLILADALRLKRFARQELLVCSNRADIPATVHSKCAVIGIYTQFRVLERAELVRTVIGGLD